MAGSTIWAPVGDKGPTGDKGPDGDPGPQGPAGPAGPGLDAFVANLLNNTDPAKGAALVGFKFRSLYTALSQMGFSPYDFGAVGGGIADDTTFVNQAIAAAAAANSKVLVNGNFGVTQALVDGKSGIHFSGKGSFVGIATTLTNCILSMKNVTNVTFSEDISINGKYNTNYECGIWGYTDGPGQACAYLDFTNLSVVNCKLAYRFGSDARPDDLVSEINIRGGNTYGCPKVLEAIGAQTVVNFNSATLASLVGTGNTAWQNLPQQTITARGATVTVTGGEFLHTTLSTGGAANDSAFNTGVLIQPITSPTSGNIWGNVTITGALIEVAGHLAASSNPSALGSLVGGALTITGCRGVCVGDYGTWIEMDPSFGASASIMVRGNSFFAPTARAQANIFCGGLADIYVDEASFGKNMFQGLGGFSGGKLHYGMRNIALCSNTGGQSLTANVQAVLGWTASSSVGDLARDSARYNTGTKQFTVGPEGLKDARIFVKIRTSVFNANVDFAVFANNVFLSGSARVPGDTITGFLQIDIPIGTIAAGTLLDVRATSSVNATITAGASDFMLISGRTN